MAQAAGLDNLGAPIAVSNAAAGDTSDDDVEDSDADDTGIASIGVVEPALSVDKQVVDVRRGGVSVGVVDPLLYGDVIVYRVTVRNVGLGTAYDVNLTDTLPAGIVIDTSAPVGAGTYAVSSPAAERQPRARRWGHGVLHLDRCDDRRRRDADGQLRRARHAERGPRRVADRTRSRPRDATEPGQRFPEPTRRSATRQTTMSRTRTPTTRALRLCA